MNIRFVLSIIALLSITLNGFAQDRQKENPVSNFILKVNDKEYLVRENEELKLDSTLNGPVISVKKANYMSFDNGSLSFKYPSNFSFEFEEDYAYKNWSLDGNSFLVMIFELNVKADLNDLVSGMVDEFGKRNCKVEKTEMKVGDRVLKGKRINVTLIGQKLTVDFLEIVSEDFKSRFLAFQDTLDENGNPTEESRGAIRMIDQSIKYE